MGAGGETGGEATTATSALRSLGDALQDVAGALIWTSLFLLPLVALVAVPLGGAAFWVLRRWRKVGTETPTTKERV